MIVGEIMTKDVLTVSPDEPMEQVAREIVNRRIGGVFVVKQGRIMGKISRKDILQHIFPSYEEFYQDLIHSIDFEEIQHRAKDLRYRLAGDVMTPASLYVSPNMHIMKVAAWMLVRDIHRLPVVDESGQIVGIVSRSDIFHHIIGSEMQVKTAPEAKTDR